MFWSCMICQPLPRLTTTKVRIARADPCLTPSGDVKPLPTLTTVPTATSDVANRISMLSMVSVVPFRKDRWTSRTSPSMNSEKYIGLDVHQATISVAVLDSTGKLVMESILETKAATILEFFAGLRGTLSVTFEEGTWAAWLYDLLKPHVAKLVVCNPRKNALLKDGNKSDRIDAHKLAELLYLNKLSSVYHGETGVRMLRELARSYLTIAKDLTRVMCRLKAVYRSWAIPCAGRDVYYTRHRAEWLGKIKEAGVRSPGSGLIWAM